MLNNYATRISQNKHKISVRNTSLPANTITAELTNHVQRTRFITSSTDKHIRLTLKMTSAQVVETSVTNNSSSQNYSHPDDHSIRTTDTPGLKPFTMLQRIFDFRGVQRRNLHKRTKFHGSLQALFLLSYPPKKY